jgi:hypothetical protein
VSRLNRVAIGVVTVMLNSCVVFASRIMCDAIWTGSLLSAVPGFTSATG